MTKPLAIAGRISLSLVGGVALYVLLYGGTALLHDAIGYDNGAGRIVGLINGALSWLGWGPIFVVLLCVAVFVLLSKLGVFESERSA